MDLPTKKAFSLFDEFKNFAFKGNVVDLAVGVIIGGAFGKIVSSMVDNLIMPLVSVVIPGDNSYKEWAFKIGEITEKLTRRELSGRSIRRNARYV